MDKHKYKAFTLIELIIVITILAILATIGFISFQSYLGDARDSNRITALKTIQKGLELYKIKKEIFPQPDNQIAYVKYNGNTLLLQGTAGIKVLSSIKSSEQKDPLEIKDYTYSITSDNKQYQLMAMLENKNIIKLSLINPNIIYSNLNYQNRYPYVIGNPVGILLDGNNVPIQETSTLININTATPEYNIVFDNSNSGTITSSGNNLYTAITDNPQSINGVCDNSIALGCISGNPTNDNSQTTCGTTRTWNCAGEYGGSDSTQCNIPNISCQTNPSNLNLTHTIRTKTFTFSWTAGSGNGGSCKLQYYKNGTTWTDISATTYNCDSNLINQSVTLPGNGWNTTWSSIQVRIIRTSDSVALGTFSQNLTCSSTSGSSTSTPNIDENCNGNWDDTSNYSCNCQTCSVTYYNYLWTREGYSNSICTTFYGYVWQDLKVGNESRDSAWCDYQYSVREIRSCFSSSAGGSGGYEKRSYKPCQGFSKNISCNCQTCYTYY